MPRVLITGANRGLGLEFARQYGAAGDRVFATCRRPEASPDLKALDGEVSVHGLNVTDLGAVETLAGELEGEAIDILVNNAGILTPGQRMGTIDYAAWEEELRVNTIGPMAVAKAFLPHLERGEGRRMAFISSTMGSIGENTSGGYYLYRSSKAALNAAVRSLAIDLATRGVIVLLFHPGWVRTDMGGPGAAIDAEVSVRGLRRLIEAAGPEDSGRFMTYAGKHVPW